MLEFRKPTQPQPGLIQTDFWLVLVIDGTELKTSQMVQLQGGTWFGTVEAPDESRQLFLLTLRDLRDTFHHIGMKVGERVDRWLRLRQVTINSSSAVNPNDRLVLQFRPDFDSWANPFSASEYLSAMKEIALEQKKWQPRTC